MNVPTPPARRLAVAAFLVLLGTGCGSVSRVRNPFAGGGGEEEQIRVRVENQNFNDATVHALRGGERIRLGEVTGKSDKSFTVRWNFSVPVEFEIHLVGGGSCVVRSFPVDPGDRIWVRIPTELYASICQAGKN